MSEKLVYSTTTGSTKKAGPQKKVGNKPPTGGPCKMRLETKGRGGKSVTVLFNLPWESEKAREVMRELQNSLGCGGSYKDHTILFQGDVREKVESYFKASGIKLVRAGG